MKINLKKPKYIIPLLAMPFLCLFFYVYSGSVSNKNQLPENKAGLNEEVGGISEQVKARELTDKLDAYRQSYKEADGLSAINAIEEEQARLSPEKKVIEDAVNHSSSVKSTKMVRQYQPGNPRISEEDKAMALAISNIGRQQDAQKSSSNVLSSPSSAEPMDIFRQQMAYMDSVSKASDPERQAGIKAEENRKKLDAAKLLAKSKLLPVKKAVSAADGFNTVMAENNEDPIMAMIAENEKGYLGSRIKVRLLETITAGQLKLAAGSMLYAEITGFSQQRVKLSISSILSGNKALPVRLEVYDLDGIEGLYVPSSSFREFSKDLGSSSVQGINIQGNSTSGQEFLMSSLDKIFRSGASAISGVIKKNKATIKYNTCIYLIDKRDNP